MCKIPLSLEQPSNVTKELPGTVTGSTDPGDPTGTSVQPPNRFPSFGPSCSVQRLPFSAGGFNNRVHSGSHKQGWAGKQAHGGRLLCLRDIVHRSSAGQSLRRVSPLPPCFFERPGSVGSSTSRAKGSTCIGSEREACVLRKELAAPRVGRSGLREITQITIVRDHHTSTYALSVRRNWTDQDSSISLLS